MKVRWSVGAVASFTVSLACGAEPTLCWLGGLGGSYPISASAAVSDDGKTVVGQASGPGGATRPFRWRLGHGMEDLGTFGGPWGEARGVSGDGTVVVGWSTDLRLRSQAFRWTVPHGLTGLGGLNGAESEAFAVDLGGTQVFGQSQHAVRWQSGQWGALPSLGGPAGSANDCSSDGRWAAGWSLTSSFLKVACLWDGSGVVPIPSPWNRPAEARAVSDGGAVVVGSADDPFGRPMAFAWTLDGGMVFLPTWGQPARAMGVSGDGQTIVGSRSSGSVLRAFVHTPSASTQDLTELAARALQGTGSWLETATAVSRNGRFIVGQGWNGAAGRREAYVLDLSGELFAGRAERIAH